MGACLLSLPTEIVEMIATHLSIEDLSNFRLTSRAIWEKSGDAFKSNGNWNSLLPTFDRRDPSTWEIAITHGGKELHTLINIDKNSMLSSWITSVGVVSNSLITTDFAYLLAQALAGLTNFTALQYIDSHRCQDPRPFLKVLIEHLPCPRLQILRAQIQKGNTGLVAILLKKHSRTLRKIFLWDRYTGKNWVGLVTALGFCRPELLQLTRRTARQELAFSKSTESLTLDIIDLNNLSPGSANNPNFGAVELRAEIRHPQVFTDGMKDLTKLMFYKRT